MSIDPKNTKIPPETASQPSNATPVVPPAAPASGEFKGITCKTIESKADDDPTQTSPQVVIEIHVIDCLKSLLPWWKEYHVGETLKEWAKETDWDKVRNEVKEGVEGVDWKEVRKQTREGLEEVDWKQVRKEANEELQKVDWKKVREDAKEGMEKIPWKEIKDEVNDVVDWKEVKNSAKEVVDVKNLKKNLTEVCPPELQKEMIGDVDLNEALKKAKEMCPEELPPCKQLRESVEDILKEEEP